MKKLVLLFAVMVVSIAVAMQAGISGQITCKSANATDYEYTTDWGAECQVDGDEISIKGIGFCSNQLGQHYETQDSISTSYDPNEHNYCWCRVIIPEVSPWVFLFDYSSEGAGDCAHFCASECANHVWNNPDFLTALFSEFNW